MGLYINPPGMSKEAFLQRHGVRMTEAEFKTSAITPEGVCAVWLDNGHFSAIGIAYNACETARFSVQDHRPRACFFLPAAAFLDAGISWEEVLRASQEQGNAR